MRAQDANRRRPQFPNEMARDSMSPRSNISSPRPGLVSPPPAPPRAMLQSSSVCDLTMTNMWTPPGMQQVILLPIFQLLFIEL